MCEDELGLKVAPGPLALRPVRLFVLSLALLPSLWLAAAASLDGVTCPPDLATNTTRLVPSDPGDFTWTSTQAADSTPPITVTQGTDTVLGNSVLLIGNQNPFASVEGVSKARCGSGYNLPLLNPNDEMDLTFNFRFLQTSTAHDFRFGLY